MSELVTGIVILVSLCIMVVFVGFLWFCVMAYVTLSTEDIDYYSKLNSTSPTWRDIL